jgi:hypothetical protein
MMVMAECTESAVASLEMSVLEICLRPEGSARVVCSRSVMRSMFRAERVDVENIG